MIALMERQVKNAEGLTRRRKGCTRSRLHFSPSLVAGWWGGAKLPAISNGDK